MSSFTSNRPTNSMALSPLYAGLSPVQYQSKLQALLQSIRENRPEVEAARLARLNARIIAIDYVPSPEQTQQLMQLELQTDILALETLLGVHRTSQQVNVYAGSDFGALPFKKLSLPKESENKLKKMLANNTGGDGLVNLTLKFETPRNEEVKGILKAVSEQFSVIKRKSHRLHLFNPNKLLVNGSISFTAGNQGIEYIGSVKDNLLHHRFVEQNGSYACFKYSYEDLNLQYIGEFNEGKREGWGYLFVFNETAQSYQLRFMGYWKEDIPNTGFIYNLHTGSKEGQLKNHRDFEGDLFISGPFEEAINYADCFSFSPMQECFVEQVTIEAQTLPPLVEAQVELAAPPVMVDREEVQRILERTETIAQEEHIPELSRSEQLARLLMLLQEGSLRAEALKDKSSIFLWGPTGAGKSVLANVLQGHEVRERHAERLEEEFEVLLPAEGGNREVAAIGYSGRSATLLPQPFVREGLSICDCPGLSDTRGGFINTANAVNIVKALENASDVRFVVLIHCADLQSGRGKLIHDTLFALKELFAGDTDSLLTHIQNGSILLAVTHVPLGRTLSQVKGEFVEKFRGFDRSEFIHCLAEKLHLFHPTRPLPQEHEGYLNAKKFLEKVSHMPGFTSSFQVPRSHLDDLRLIALSQDLREQITQHLEAGCFDDLAEVFSKQEALCALRHPSLDMDYQTARQQIFTFIHQQRHAFSLSWMEGDLEEAQRILALLKQLSIAFSTSLDAYIRFEELESQLSQSPEDWQFLEVDRQINDTLERNYDIFEEQREAMQVESSNTFAYYEQRLEEMQNQRMADRATQEDLIRQLQDLRQLFEARENQMHEEQRNQQLDLIHLREHLWREGDEETVQEPLSRPLSSLETLMGDRADSFKNYIFDEGVWWKHFGTIGEFPALPEDIIQLFPQISREFGGVGQNRLFLLPKEVNGNSLTLKYFLNLIFPQNAQPLIQDIEVQKDVIEKIGDIPVEKSSWQLFNYSYSLVKRHPFLPNNGISNKARVPSLLAFLVGYTIRQLATPEYTALDGRFSTEYDPFNSGRSELGKKWELEKATTCFEFQEGIYLYINPEGKKIFSTQAWPLNKCFIPVVPFHFEENSSSPSNSSSRARNKGPATTGHKPKTVVNGRGKGTIGNLLASQKQIRQYSFANRKK